jgi:hypothetical protein
MTRLLRRDGEIQQRGCFPAAALLGYNGNCLHVGIKTYHKCIMMAIRNDGVMEYRPSCVTSQRHVVVAS